MTTQNVSEHHPFPGRRGTKLPLFGNHCSNEEVITKALQRGDSAQQLTRQKAERQGEGAEVWGAQMALHVGAWQHGVGRDTHPEGVSCEQGR